jgi:hypothetical protein
MYTNTNFVNPDNENIEQTTTSEVVTKENNDTSFWSLIVKYYKQIILLLLIFVIIYVIEIINKYNLMNGAPTPSIPGLASAASVASSVLKKKSKGKK